MEKMNPKKLILRGDRPKDYLAQAKQALFLLKEQLGILNLDTGTRRIKLRSGETLTVAQIAGLLDIVRVYDPPMAGEEEVFEEYLFPVGAMVTVDISEKKIFWTSEKPSRNLFIDLSTICPTMYMVGPIAVLDYECRIGVFFYRATSSSNWTVVKFQVTDPVTGVYYTWGGKKHLKYSFNYINTETLYFSLQGGQDVYVPGLSIHYGSFTYDSLVLSWQPLASYHIRHAVCWWTPPDPNNPVFSLTDLKWHAVSHTNVEIGIKGYVGGSPLSTMWWLNHWVWYWAESGVTGVEGGWTRVIDPHDSEMQFVVTGYNPPHADWWWVNHLSDTDHGYGMAKSAILQKGYIDYDPDPPNGPWYVAWIALRHTGWYWANDQDYEFAVNCMSCHPLFNEDWTGVKGYLKVWACHKHDVIPEQVSQQAWNSSYAVVVDKSGTPDSYYTERIYKHDYSRNNLAVPNLTKWHINYHRGFDYNIGSTGATHRNTLGGGNLAHAEVHDPWAGEITKGTVYTDFYFAKIAPYIQWNGCYYFKLPAKDLYGHSVEGSPDPIPKILLPSQRYIFGPVTLHGGGKELNHPYVWDFILQSKYTPVVLEATPRDADGKTTSPSPYDIRLNGRKRGPYRGIYDFYQYLHQGFIEANFGLMPLKKVKLIP